VKTSPGGVASAACSRAAVSLALAVDGGDEGGQDGEPLAGAGVHAGFGPGLLLLVLDVAGADGAGDGPGSPAGGVVQGPLGEVEVERPDQHQGVAGGLADDGLLAAAARADGPDLDALLPGGGDVGWQVQGADAGVVVFDVLPEPSAQRDGQGGQGAVVDAGLALAQVVHEQVPDRPAGQVVAVDELLGGELAGELGVEHPDRGWRSGREDPCGGQELVEERAERAVLGTGGERGPAAAQQLDAVAGGDRGDLAALGGHDRRDPLQRQVEGAPPDRAGLPQCVQGREPGGVTDAAHLRGDPAGRRRGQQPGQSRADDVAADQLDQACAEPVVQPHVPGGQQAGVVEVGQHPLPPVPCSARLGAGCLPPPLPGRPLVELQPVQGLQQGHLAPVSLPGVSGQERRGEQAPGNREPVRGRLLPRRRDQAGREPVRDRQRLGAGQPGPARRRRGHRGGGHQRPLPNSTSRLSAR
jgi:hypothetical protein